jgi:hypothetical protein
MFIKISSLAAFPISKAIFCILTGSRISCTIFDLSSPVSVELCHHGEECSFDAIIKKYDLDKKDPALLELAKIVRGADTPNRSLTPQSEGLVAVASGFSIISINDHDNMAKQFYVYDALYAFANLQQQIRIVLQVVTNNNATNTEEKDTAAEALSYSLGQIYLEHIYIHYYMKRAE